MLLTGNRVERSSKMTGQLDWRADSRTAIDIRLPRCAMSRRRKVIPNVGSTGRNVGDVQSLTTRRVAEAENLRGGRWNPSTGSWTALTDVTQELDCLLKAVS